MPKEEAQPDSSLQATLTDMPEPAVKSISNSLTDGDILRLSKVCRRLHGLFAHDLHKRAGRALWQFIFTDNQSKAAAILRLHPDLLGTVADHIFTSKEAGNILHPHTWQRFDLTGVSSLTFVIMRNQTDMLSTIVKAVEESGDKLTAEQRRKIMTQWNDAEVSLKSSIERSKQFTDRPEVGFKALIRIIAQETSPKGPLSEETENALQKFRETLLLRGAIKLGDYCEIMHLLLTAYQAYEQAFRQFQDWAQPDVFCIKVIGYIQSLLPVEIAKVFCEGGYYIVEQGHPISAGAADLLLVNGQRFYRDGVDAGAGLGFNFLVRVGGGAGGACDRS